MLDHALQYAGRGWAVFPVTGYKTPLKGSHGHLDATTDPATIERLWSARPGANIALATGKTVVIDADGPGAVRRLLALAAAHGGLPPTPVSRTARGLHLFFSSPAGGEIRTRNERRKKGEDGIDIKGHGGFVVLPPSINAKTNFTYQWVSQHPLSEMPRWLMEWLQTIGAPAKKTADDNAVLRSSVPDYVKQKPKSDQRSISDSLQSNLTDPWSPSDEARIRSALAAIPATGYDRWREIGMALHALGWQRPDGTDAAFDLFDEWSATEPEQYAAAETEKKWASFGRTGRHGITLGTLFHHAEQCGWQGYYEAPPAIRSAQPPTGETTATISSPADMLNGQRNGYVVPSTMLVDPATESPLIALNQSYAAIGDIGGKCLVLGWVPSKVDETVQVPSFQSFRAFTERYAHCRVTLRKQNKEGEWVEDPQQLGAAWLKWRHRKSFEGIDLVPSAADVLPGNVLNLWRGFAIEPKVGSWALMQQHIIEVLARGEASCADYILRWAAWSVQNPDDRAEAALTFRGIKGSGKGTFARALRQIFGQHGLQVFNSKHLVGAFNGHLRSCLLLYADEAFWAGDKQGESVLKGMLTEPTLIIEQKGIDATQWRNRLHVIMTANAEWVVPASHDERRYAVFDVSSDRVGDKKYFEALYDEMRNDGLGAMLHDLLAADLEDWHPRQIIDTEALREQKARSMSPLHEWYEALLQDGILPYVSREYPDVANSAQLCAIAREAVPRLRELTTTALGRFLNQMGAIKIHRAGGNAWRLPPLVKARQIWEAKFKTWKWEAPIADWQKRN